MSIKISKTLLNIAVHNFNKYGRKEIVVDVKDTIGLRAKQEIKKCKSGTLISYELKDGRYSKGGFLLESDQKYFVYYWLTFTKRYRVKYKAISKLWLGDVYKVNEDFISFKKAEISAKLKCPIKIGNVIVKYVKDNYCRKRFMVTERYKTMVKWYEIFGKDKNKLLKEENTNEAKKIILGIIGSKNCLDYKTFEKSINEFEEKHGEIDQMVLGDSDNIDKIITKYTKNNDIVLTKYQIDNVKSSHTVNKLVVTDSTHLMIFLISNNKTVTNVYTVE